MNDLEFLLFSLSSLFVIVDPIGTAPTFLAMTADNSPAQRKRTAWVACTVALMLLLAFATVGTGLLDLFGISMPAFAIAGSVVLMIVALDMLQARPTPVVHTPEETTAGQAKDDIAISPLAMPMLAGPAAFTTVVMLHDEAGTWDKRLILYIVIVAVCTLTFVILRLAASGARWLGPLALKLTTRIMGLVLAAIAVQFVINALRDLKVIPDAVGG